MKKNKVIAIGKELNMFQIFRMCEKVYGVDITNEPGCKAMHFISHSNIKKDRDKLFEFFRETILREDIEIFNFDSKEDLELFDKDGILRERSYYIDTIDNYTRGADIFELFVGSRKLKSHGMGKNKVILVDPVTNKKYMIDAVDPVRYTHGQKDIEFEIYEIENSNDNK